MTSLVRIGLVLVVGLLTTLSTQAQTTPTGDSLDVVLVIDSTGSMRDDILAVENRIREIVDQLSSNSSDWRLALITYRDHPQAPYGEPTDYVSRLEFGFTANLSEISAGVSTIQVDGGGDQPEAVFAGLREAVQMPWRDGVRRSIILMGDAPPHIPDPVLGLDFRSVLQPAYDDARIGIFPILITTENAVRFPFQSLADGSGGRMFYASDVQQVVPTLLTTIDIAAGVRLDVGQDVQIGGLEPGTFLYGEPTLDAIVMQDMPRSTRATIITGPELTFDVTERGVLQYFYWWQLKTEMGTQGWVHGTFNGEPTLIITQGDDLVDVVTCRLMTFGDINIRNGPGTNYQQVASRLGPDVILAADGQFQPGDGFTWWRIIEGYWIREDLVREDGDCTGLPRVKPIL
jgi:hypothetical protein